MAAEAMGIFFYPYPGIASQASIFLNGAEPAFGSIFQTGLAYAMYLCSRLYCPFSEWFASRGIFEAFASGPLGTLKVSDEMQGLLLPLLSAVRLLVVTLTPQ
jgi:hypothetical protein